MSDVLKLNTELYPQKVIISAVKAYGTLADIKVRMRGNYWECTFDGCRYDPVIVMREFENYIIDLMNVNKI